jgi:hypothetical protein
MKALKYYLPLLFIFFSGFSGYAQKDLSINEIFEGVGKQNGTLIQLGTDVLSPRTNILLYKSLRIKADAGILEMTEEALRSDTQSAEVLLSSIQEKEGSRTVHYELRKANNSLFHEYILFNYRNGYISLVYIKGNFPSKDLKKELDKLKDLFIELK